MSIKQKLGIGLFLLVSLATFGLFAHKAFAAPCEVAACSNQDILAADGTYKFVDDSTISATFKGGSVQFTDGDGPGGGVPGLKHYYLAPGGTFCSGGSGVGSIIISDSGWEKLKGGAKSVAGSLDVDWFDSGAKVGEKPCKDFKAGGEDNKHAITVSNDGNEANISYYWDGDNIVAADGSVTLSLGGSKDGYYLYKTGDPCGKIVVLNAPDANKGVEYVLEFPGGGLDDAGINPLLSKFYAKGICKIKSGPRNVNIEGTKGAPPGGGGAETGMGCFNRNGNHVHKGVCTPEETAAGFTTEEACYDGEKFLHKGPCTEEEKNGGGAGQTTPTCESNFSFGFEWFLCPALRLADSAAGALNNFVEDQLCINAGASDTAGAVQCGGKEILTNQTKDAWSAFRVIATSLLVIVMLIAIISQSAGIGPIDAYTLRKLLPKMVAAVILIQISWYLAKFAVDLSNDLGKGIQSLMYAPFGGAQNMKLDDLIGTQIGTATGSSANANTFALFAVLAGSIAILVSLPGILLLGLYTVLALFVAFFVLLLRKIFILLLIIIVPLALVAGILSNTEKYWKSWSNNFTKLLLMFPMIMALIAAGRIFAYLATDPLATIFRTPLAVVHLGPLPVPYFSDAGDFATLAIIILAFFAPYFLLPMTFKWGGQIMGLVGAAVATNGLTKGMREKSKGFSDDLDKRVKGNIANRYSTTTPDGAGRTTRFGSFMKRRAIGVATGNYLPTERHTRRILGQGFEYKEDLIKGKQGLMQNDYTEVLSRTGSVGKAKEAIRDKYGWSDDQYDQRAFYNWLIDTRSGMELGDEKWRTAGGTKPDLAKTQGFMSALHADGGRYAQVAQWFPVFQPFYSEIGGGPKSADYLEGGKRFLDRKDEDTGEVTKARPARDMTEAKLFADDERFAKWLGNINDPRELAAVRPEMYEMMSKVHAGLKGMGHESQSTKLLQGLLEESAGTMAGQQSIRPLAGGQESARKHIDGMLGDGYLEKLVLSEPGGGASVDQLTEAVTRGMRAGQQGQEPASIQTDVGVINIQHEPRVITPRSGEGVSQGGVIIPPGTRSTEAPPGPGEDQPPG